VNESHERHSNKRIGRVEAMGWSWNVRSGSLHAVTRPPGRARSGVLGWVCWSEGAFFDTALQGGVLAGNAGL
jgi:hypothetical protein